MSAIYVGISWGHKVLTIISISFLEGYDKLIGVNLSWRFGGNGFLPESVAGFIQPIILKPGFRVTWVKSPFS